MVDYTERDDREEDANGADDQSGVLPVTYLGGRWQSLSFQLVKFSGHSQLLTHLVKELRLFFSGRVVSLSGGQLSVVDRDQLWSEGKVNSDIFSAVESDGFVT